MSVLRAGSSSSAPRIDRGTQRISRDGRAKLTAPVGSPGDALRSYSYHIRLGWGLPVRPFPIPGRGASTQIAKWIIASIAVVNFGGFVADAVVPATAKQHLQNSRWPPHAKFHNGQTMLMGIFNGSIR